MIHIDMTKAVLQRVSLQNGQACPNVLFLADGANGASGSTSAAGHASVGIDLVVRIAFADRADGALSRASAAAYASIANYICHGNYLLKIKIKVLLFLYSKPFYMNIQVKNNGAIVLN